MTRVMLASSEGCIRFPCVVSRKIDGVRCTYSPQHGVLTRTNRVLPNEAIRRMILSSDIAQHPGLTLLDGELCRTDVSFHETSGQVRTTYGSSVDMIYHVFDMVLDDAWETPFIVRFSDLCDAMSPHPQIHIVPHRVLRSDEEMQEELLHAKMARWEGIMIRALDGPYKHGRSTPREGWLIKRKFIEESEATIVDVLQLKKNLNPPKRDPHGLIMRSKIAAGLHLEPKIGAFVVQTDAGIQFQIGSGFTDEQRTTWWTERRRLIGQRIRYAYQPAGTEEAPRIPTFQGFHIE